MRDGRFYLQFGWDAAKQAVTSNNTDVKVFEFLSGMVESLGLGQARRPEWNECSVECESNLLNAATRGCWIGVFIVGGL